MRFVAFTFKFVSKTQVGTMEKWSTNMKSVCTNNSAVAARSDVTCRPNSPPADREFAVRWPRTITATKLLKLDSAENIKK